MHRLANTVRDYPWGSPTVIPELLGRPPDGTPQAELWIGAHPEAPSRLVASPAHRGATSAPAETLYDHIGRDPEAALGQSAVAVFGPQLPFLLKVLAVDEPLSLQAHPTRAQARAGFAAEQRAGVAPDAPERTYRDDNHKPELLCAVTEFDALCGFRPVPATVELLRSLDVPGLRSDVVELAAGAAGAVDLLRLVRRWLMLGAADRGAIVTQVRAASSVLGAAGGALAAEATTISDLAQRYPNDGGVLVATLLNRVRLQPGEAVFLPPGNLHAYLHGTGIEIMASSNNVLRGGLTSKHVDVEGLLSILDAAPGPPAVLRPVCTPMGDDYPAPVPDFALSVLRPRGGQTYDLPSGAPQLLFVLDGAAQLDQDGVPIELARGQSVFLGAEEPPVIVGGSAVVVRASIRAPLLITMSDRAG